ncbi:MAG TPA: prepilin-type N-terminal cleavage/methylation domain-containing protein [Candidatus Nanoarchaeia archaeon]|nr:prepilin-type N-terminal cleavage/methylation domain-containing protein [Candidatus Nanoarchaeia archaeon]
MVKKNLKQGGFTLVELLVVIAIIGLLSTLSIVALNNARLRSRDAARVASIKQWQTALELYYSDVGSYPAAASTTPGTALVHNGTTYMAQVPHNQKPYNDDGCASNDFIYTLDSSTTYHIKYCLGSATGGVNAGNDCATPAGIMDGNGC